MSDEGITGDADILQQELPEGVKKEILQDGEAATFMSPQAGDEVTVHYVGRLSDGSEFDSSRARGKAFSFTLGKGQVIQGWDLGVATMRKGEVAKFTLAPDYAYGAEGSPPKIPKNAALEFEIELLDFVSRDDVFGDGGVVKLLTREGSGWKVPKSRSELKIALKATKDDRLIEDKGSFEYTMGSGALGAETKALEKALTGMKRGEACTLTCSKEYAYADHDGAVLHLVLEEIYEVTDVSLAKDKSIMKKQIQDGEGFERPKECCKVSLKVEAATAQGAPVPGFEAKSLEFRLGDGEVCDALECAAGEMKRGERAQLTARGALCRDPRLGLAEAPAAEVVLTIELTAFEKGKDTWDMSEEEKLDFASARKEAAAKLFKAGRFQMAMERYKRIVDMFSYIDSFKEESQAKAAELKKLCTLNRAACQLKLRLFGEAKASCEAVLQEDSCSVKALFRRAQALFGLKDFVGCVAEVKKVLDLEPQNREARLLAQDAAKAQKEEDKKSRGLFGKMCQALGTGPIPEPYKDRRLELDGEAEHVA